MLILTTVLAFHSAALAAVLLATRDAVLLDAAGRPMARDGAWLERYLPTGQGAGKLAH